MAIYVPKFNGYIVDVANLIFIRCDNTPFYYNEASQTNFSDTMNNVTITGGQGNSPLAIIDTNRDTQFTFTSAQFTNELFEMANNVTAVDKDYGAYEADKYEVQTGLKVVLPFEVQPTSVLIRGLEYADTLAAGKYTVVYAAGTTDTDPATTITFNTGDVAIGDEVLIFYKRRIVNAHVTDVKTNSTSAKGSLHAYWPVYSDGTDCTEASKKGVFHLYMPRARVTAMPGFDNSAKSASTNAVTFALLDPKRADKSAFQWAYEQLDANGEIVTDYTGTMNWNS
jgi:hypothetical protein